MTYSLNPDLCPYKESVPRFAYVYHSDRCPALRVVGINRTCAGASIRWQYRVQIFRDGAWCYVLNPYGVNGGSHNGIFSYCSDAHSFMRFCERFSPPLQVA